MEKYYCYNFSEYAQHYEIFEKLTSALKRLGWLTPPAPPLSPSPLFVFFLKNVSS